MISCAKRSATAACSAARAVVLAVTRMCRPHRHGTTPAQRAFARNHAHLEARSAQRASIWNHAQHTITLGIPSNQHHERSYHAHTTSAQHNGPSCHFCTTGFCTPQDRQNVPSGRPIRRIPNEKGMTITLPRVPNGLPLSCAALIDRNAVQLILAFKKARILGPRSGVGYSGGLGGSADRCRSEACGRSADTIQPPAFGRTTLI